MLPQRIVKSADVAGKISEEASKLCGLLEGTPVIAGGIDAPVASLSAGVLEEKNHVAMAGTSICWGVVHKGQHLSPKLVSFPYVAYDDEMIYTFGGAATAGGIVRWFLPVRKDFYYCHILWVNVHRYGILMQKEP
jgi:xylulokinase